MINLTLTQVVLVPPILILLGAVSLLNFKNLFVLITNYSTKYSSNEIIKTVKPGLLYVKNFLEAVVGKASSFTFKLEHILLVAIIFALLAVANEIAIGNELKEKELKLLRAQAKAANEKKEGDKKKD
ncbi:unnamed protein product [Aphanomyces euteiches]|uniref:Uncharacterized protein n=1 Tax=Aphanomyces euteiches TaxID=100861 RepID=A0A6G0WTF6_9STRA|nr:hypothetical protein Ae201684_011843 [Aphanomyces euteiches]KAH9104316.1 hypothetical protein LEN26_015052 [Aphanomyces euteiches]KAH9129035.1 hypothetical protein AeMF1_000863 [Aphanomyces euteiches]KAH9157387.1 hypothetical protein AeRB84_000751 [Aphanomyces euteiches]KAH9196244.1 hypothetical protein AeNC1_001763 [Aphanomyces euteiches]